MISAGSMKWKARIFRETDFDDLGTRQKFYTGTSRYFRCSLQEGSSSEGTYGNGTYVTTSYEVRTRWDTVKDYILPTDRLEVKGKMLKIVSITNGSEKDRVMIIECEEVV